MNVTAVLAHPDDELMCAGTLARFENVTLVTLFVDGRRNEWLACAKELGYTAVVGNLDEDTFAWTRLAVRQLEPQLPNTDLWITHHADDANTSHGHIAKMVRTFARKNRASVWECDQSLPGGISPTVPNLYVNISEQQAEKRAAVNCYQSQLVRYPGMEEAIEHRDRLNGWQIGVEAAEAFTIHKAVW